MEPAGRQDEGIPARPRLVAGPGGKEIGGLDRVLILAVAALLVWSAGYATVPDMHMAVVAPAWDLVFDTVGLITTLAVALLGWIRYRETGQGYSLFQAAAFLTLALPNGVHLLVLLASASLADGMSLAGQSQAPIYSFAVSRLGAALLLAAGMHVRSGAWTRPAVRIALLGPAAAVLVVVGAAQVAPGSLPGLGNAARTVVAGEEPSAATPFGTLLGVLTGVMLLYAAAMSRRYFHTTRAIDDAYVSVGLVFGSFAQIDSALHPTFAGLVTSGDFLRLAFYLVLFAGLVARIHATVRELSASNATLARLKDAEAERAALEERTRLSRELHDGLAQTLWFVKLKTTRLEPMPSLPADARSLAAEIGRGVDEALDEARQAVMSLRSPTGGAAELPDMLARTVDEFEDRYGIRAELHCRPPIPRLPARIEAELLRICQEALTNVARHADATLVRVEASVEGDALSLMVRDNGRGFDPKVVGEGHFGLAGMLERARIAGGVATVESEPLAGARVIVKLPLGGPALTGEA